MTNLSDLFPAGAGKQVSFTASGNVTSSGKPVILNSDGTVSEVSGSADNFGSITEIFPASMAGQEVRGCYDEGADRWVFIGVVFTGGVYAPHLTVASLSGTTWTFGTPIVYPFASRGTDTGENWDICYDSDNGQIILAGEDFNNSSYLYAVAGTVNAGTGTISWGSSVLVASNTIIEVSCIYDPSTSHVIIAYNNTSGTYVEVIVGDVSGSTLSFPSSAVSTSIASSSVFKVFYDPNANKSVLFLRTSSTTMAAKTITLSGNTPSLGANVTVLTSTSTAVGNLAGTFDSTNNTFVFSVYGSSAAATYTNIINTFTVSGTTGTAGTQTNNGTTADGNNYFATPVYDPDLNRITALYQGNLNYLQSFTISLTGTTPNFVVSTTAGPTVVSGVVSVPWGVNAYDPDQDITIVAGAFNYSGGIGQAIAYSLSSTNVTASNFLGISDAAISSAASGNITMKGGIASTGLSSLTPGSDYYVQDDGTITTVSSSVKAGKALSATAINLEYTS